jgi:16S rRNA (cytosine1407-C5)-methyltransferase
VRPTTFRVNTIKSSDKIVQKELEAHKIAYKKIETPVPAYVLEDTDVRVLETTNMYKNGEIYVQSVSSMLPAVVMDPQATQKVLDICAAPGSKTSQIAALLNNTGEILALDNSRIRIYKLEANIKRLGITNTSVRLGAGQAFWTSYPEYFDHALVDVPCSMEGRFLTTDIKSYENWSVKKVKELSEKQKWILRSAISATKPGGTIIYSTCTLSPEENEGVIDWILKKEKGKVQLEDIILQNAPSSPGVTQWKEKLYNPTMSKTIRIYPTDLYEGFFIAKLKKLSSSVPSRLIN